MIDVSHARVQIRVSPSSRLVPLEVEKISPHCSIPVGPRLLFVDYTVSNFVLVFQIWRILHDAVAQGRYATMLIWYVVGVIR